MGNKLSQADHTDHTDHTVRGNNRARKEPVPVPDGADRPITPIPWLDEETEHFLRHALSLLIERCPDLQAAILYGSVARRTARPLNDPHPSDVDVLLIFLPEGDLDTVSAAQRAAVSWAKVDVIDQYPQARDLQFMPTLFDLARWDTSFIENVARDGILLWARSSLPAPFNALRQGTEGAAERTDTVDAVETAREGGAHATL